MTRSSLFPIVPTTTSGTELASILNQRNIDENSGHLGSGRPSYATEGMIYSDNAFTPPHLFLAIGPGPTQASDIDLTTIFNDRPGTLRMTSEVRLPPAVGTVFPWLWCDGTAWPRITYPALFDAICPTFNGTVSLNSNAITGISENLVNLGLVGAPILGLGIPGGTLIGSFSGTTQINMYPPTAVGSSTNVNTPLRAFPHGAGNGSTTFNVPNLKGRVVVGRQDMLGNDNGLLTYGNGAGFDGTRLCNGGGVAGLVLNSAHLPSHGHTASASAWLTAWSISTVTAYHRHYLPAANYGSGDSAPSTHTHTSPAATSFFLVNDVSGAGSLTIGSGVRATTQNATAGGGSHSHTTQVYGWTGYDNEVAGSHSHNINSLTLAASATVDASPAPTSGFGIVQPSWVENIVIKT